MQLVAYGAQDIYLTGNPQITFFKVVYRRHTNFSMECIEQTFNGGVGIGASVTATISRNGDLVHRMYVTSETAGITNGSAIVTDCELEIGGQRIDKHYTEWMQVWNELTTPESKAIGLKAMQGDIGSSNTTGVKNVVQVPLLFWFCRNPGLALPLIALQYHEVKVKITLGDVTTGAPAAQLWADYIYLDTDERRRFAQVSHEYLIEQLQKETYDTGTGAKKLNFNHPVKELIWVPVLGASSTSTYQLKLNGHDRFAKQSQEYFSLRQPYDYHTAVPRQNLPVSARSQVLAGSNLNRAITHSSGAGATGLIPKDTGVNAADHVHYDVAHADNASGAGRPSMELHTTEVGNLGLVVGTGIGTDSTSVGDVIAFVLKIQGDATQYTTTNLEVGQIHLVEISGVSAANHGTAAANGHIISFVTSPANAAVGGAVFSTAFVDATGDGRMTINRLDPSTVTQARTSTLDKSICVYSFALKPEEHQPSGTCNFSRIDNAQLDIQGAVDGGGTIYAVNYNVLRIMSGMGGLAYSN